LGRPVGARSNRRSERGGKQERQPENRSKASDLGPVAPNSMAEKPKHSGSKPAGLGLHRRVMMTMRDGRKACAQLPLHTSSSALVFAVPGHRSRQSHSIQDFGLDLLETKKPIDHDHALRARPHRARQNPAFHTVLPMPCGSRREGDHRFSFPGLFGKISRPTPDRLWSARPGPGR